MRRLEYSVGTTISIAHSPDSDDSFMFWALRTGEIRTPGVRLSFAEYPTDELNRRALSGADDVVAVSSALLPRILDEYALLPVGASVGRGSGPPLVAMTLCELSDLVGKRIAVPGETTTACALLRKMLPRAIPVEVPIAPYAKVFHFLRDGIVDAAVLIHEGQLDYERFGCVEIQNLGQWWEEINNGLPLVLGVNVVRRSLGRALIEDLSFLFRHAIEWALEHTDEVLPRLVEKNIARGSSVSDVQGIRQYLRLYANRDSCELTHDALLGLERLIGQRVEVVTLP